MTAAELAGPASWGPARDSPRASTSVGTPTTPAPPLVLTRTSASITAASRAPPSALVRSAIRIIPATVTTRAACTPPSAVVFRGPARTRRGAPTTAETSIHPNARARCAAPRVRTRAANRMVPAGFHAPIPRGVATTAGTSTQTLARRFVTQRTPGSTPAAVSPTAVDPGSPCSVNFRGRAVSLRLAERAPRHPPPSVPDRAVGIVACRSVDAARAVDSVAAAIADAALDLGSAGSCPVGVARRAANISGPAVAR